MFCSGEMKRIMSRKKKREIKHTTHVEKRKKSSAFLFSFRFSFEMNGEEVRTAAKRGS
jgi:hypothetical protein